MTGLLNLFIDNLLPIFLIAGAGYLVAKTLRINPRPLSQIVFYVFSPCLVFNLIVHSRLSNGDILRMAALVIASSIIVGMITWAGGRILKLERRMLAAVLISSLFMNAGNYGLPVLLFAFGEEALSHGSLFFVITAVLTYTVGVVIASMGTTNAWQALLNALKIPSIYALLFGVLTLRLDWQIPAVLERTLQIVGNASIPSMLLILGLQLESARWTARIAPLVLTNSMRLLVAPLLAIWLSLVIGLQGPARQAGVVESAMPSAVLVTILATEYDVEPAFVTTAVFTSTLLSPITLTLLLAYLGG